MATKTKTHIEETKSKNSSKRGASSRSGAESLVEAAASAAEELGRAAAAFKLSWNHVKKAQSKAQPATKVVARTAKKTWAATKSTAKSMMPGKKKKGT